MPEKNILEQLSEKSKNSVSLKVFTVFVLALLLLIPLMMIKRLIKEREMRKYDVISEVSAKWGKEQTLAGPVVTIPYKSYYKTKEGKTRYNVKYMHLLPDELDIKGEIFPTTRYRGIYEVVLYNARLEVSGTFSYPRLKELKISSDRVMWRDAFIAASVSDMRGIQEQINLRFNKKTVLMNPGIETTDVFGSGMSAKIRFSEGVKENPFSFNVNLNGSSRVNFVPVGKVTTVALSSKWQDPSFGGAFLPEQRSIGKDGFSAKWRVLHINRSFPQYWTGSKHKLDETPPSWSNVYDDLKSAPFGVKLFTPVDVYQKSTRSAKYGIMFIVFTFAAVFFSEVMVRVRVHPIQYILIGLAIMIFYSLLISISEHLNFDAAYLISSAVITIMVTAYSSSVLKSKNLSLMVGGVLVILYGYFYILLQLKDYALLLGSVGLIAVLAAVMYLTRRVDWYSVKIGRDES